MVNYFNINIKCIAKNENVCTFRWFTSLLLYCTSMKLYFISQVLPTKENLIELGFVQMLWTRNGINSEFCVTLFSLM